MNNNEFKKRVINLKQESNKLTSLFEYKKVGFMNNYMFNLLRAKDRLLDFHSHEDTDEVFYVLEGKMKIEFRDAMIELKAGELCIVPKGEEHRPVCEDEVVVMLIEPEGTLHAKNTGGAYAG